MSSPEHKQKVWSMIKPIKVGMLVTQTQEALHARPMHLVQDEYNGTLWFFTKINSDKVDEVNDGHPVCLTFADKHDESYVSLTGFARITRDQLRIDKFWNPFVAAWFPKGKNSPEIGLLEIKIESGEYWDTTSSKLVQLYEIAKANITHTLPDMGENKKFGTL